MQSEAAPVAEAPAASLLRNPPTGSGAQLLHLYESGLPARESNPVDADSRLRHVLATTDVVATATALATTSLLLSNTLNAVLLVAALLVVPLNKMLGLYDRDAHVMNKTTLDEVPLLLNSAMVMAFAGAAAFDLSQPGGEFSARALAVLVALSTLLVAAGRVGGRRVTRLCLPAERCLVIGPAAECEELRRKLSLSPTANALVIARAPITASGAPGLRDMRDSIARHSIDRVILIPDDQDPDAVSDTIRAVKSFRVKMTILPRMLEAIGGSVERDEICGVELMGVRDFSMSHSSRLAKRSLDVAAAALGLLVISPLLAIFALAIKLDSPGPVFYRQRRIGRDGEAFSMVKFRTMVDGADRQKQALLDRNETSGLFKMADDPRITRVGGLLRSSSMDELPQLLNVLFGDMSLVGPRPLVPDEDENITGWYRRRSQITPGITGVWQLHGPVRIPLDEMVKIDYTYVANWSLWSDIKILMRTVPHVLARRGL